MSKIDTVTLTGEERAIIEARRAYQKKWRAENKDKVKAANNRFWAKKAAELIESEGNTSNVTPN